jgi:hypothetical protein
MFETAALFPRDKLGSFCRLCCATGAEMKKRGLPTPHHCLPCRRKLPSHPASFGQTPASISAGVLLMGNASP